jgi:hypothetical protein
LKERAFADLIAEADSKAIKDSGIEKKAIRAIYVGNFGGPAFVG